MATIALIRLCLNASSASRFFFSSSSGDEDLIAELRLQIGDHPVVCRGGGRKHGNVGGKAAEHLLQAAVFQAKIMSPVGNAVRLVDDKEADPHLRQRLLHVVPEQRLRRNKHKVGLPVPDRLQYLVAAVLCRAVERVAAKSYPCGCLDLIFHEDEQRTDHQRYAGALLAQEPRTDKIDQALAPAGALHDKRPPVQHGRLDSLVLAVAKARVLSVQASYHAASTLINVLIVNLQRLSPSGVFRFHWRSLYRTFPRSATERPLFFSQARASSAFTFCPLPCPRAACPAARSSCPSPPRSAPRSIPPRVRRARPRPHRRGRGPSP